jgi:hypothetical protein
VTLLAAGQSAASQAAPGALGFLVVAGMGLAIFFLFRSMTKQLRKVRVGADDAAASAEAGLSAEAGSPAQGGSPAKAGRPGGASAPGRVSTGAAATDAAANKEAGGQGS